MDTESGIYRKLSVGFEYSLNIQKFEGTRERKEGENTESLLLVTYNFRLIHCGKVEKRPYKHK